MKTRILSVIGLGFMVLAVAMSSQTNIARADSETDRLREALRTATVQMRQLDDVDREKAAAKAQIDAAKAEVRQTEKQYREAVDEFNKRLAERDTTLEKWKTAYEEAAGVARDKDAARAKFEGEAAAYKASTKSCVAKNGQLIQAGHDLLQRYQTLTVGEIIVAHEPMLGLRRVEIQNAIQDFKDKILDQKAVP